MRLLISRGADVNGRDHPEGRNPLLCAVSRRNVEAAAVLVELGADLEVREFGNKTALRIVVDAMPDFGTDTRMLKMLVDAGADMVGCGALHMAALKGNLTAVEIMVRAGADVNAVCALHSDDGLGKTAREYFDDDCRLRIGNQHIVPWLRDKCAEKESIIHQLLPPRNNV